MYAMVGPYIVAVLVRFLAHVHLLCLDRRVAILRRLLWGSAAVKIVLLVLHDCVCAVEATAVVLVGGCAGEAWVDV